MIYKEFEISKVEQLNYSDYENIFHDCFNIKVDDKYFKWKYFSNPHGKIVAFQAFSGNKLAAFYGVIPEEYWINGKKELIYQSMDTMTHSDFRNKGLFVKLAETTYKFIEDNNNPFKVIGIPGSNSLYGFINKLGWKKTKDIKYIFCNRILNKIQNNFIKKSIQITEFKKFDSKYDSFIESLTIKEKVKKVFNSEILNWKIANPALSFINFEIRDSGNIIGYIIIKIVDDKNYLIYYYEFSNENFDNVLSAFTSFIFKNYPVNNLFSWEPNNMNIKKIFRKSGFIINPFKKGPFSYRIPFIIKSSDSDFINNCKNDMIFIQPIIQD
jgi:hypothetical protein